MGKLYTPFNGPAGESHTTDDEAMLELQRQRGTSDAAAAAALAAQVQMHQADLAERSAGRMQQGAQFERGLGFEGDQAKQGRDFAGGMFDRQAGLSRDLDRGATDRAFGLADRQNVIGLDKNKLAREEFEATNWKNEMQKNFLQQRLGQMGGAGGAGAIGGAGGAPGGGGLGAAMTPQDESDMLMSILSGQPMQNRQQRELGDLNIAEAKRKAASAQVDDYIKAGDIAAAEALGKQAGVAVNKPKFGDPDAELADLKTQAGTFGTKDASWGLNDDPTAEDVSLLDAKANRAVELLVRDKGMSPEEAKRVVNMAMQEVLNPHRGMNTGWIDTLYSQRGIR